MKRPTILAPLAVCAFLAGCGQPLEEAAVNTVAPPEPVTETATETTQVTVSEEPPAQEPAGDGVEAISPNFSTGEKTLDSVGDELYVVTDARAGDHGSFDRVVFELNNPGSPGVYANYVDTPTQQGSGFRVDMKGQAFLMVVMRRNDQLAELGYPYTGSEHISAGNVAGVASGNAFEGDDWWYIGLDKKRPYAIGVLENPTRLVVDVQK